MVFGGGGGGGGGVSVLIANVINIWSVTDADMPWLDLWSQQNLLNSLLAT